MPISYCIKKEDGIVICRHEGKTGDREFIDAYESLFADPDYTRGFNQFVDLRLAKSTGRSAEALRAIGGLVELYYAGSGQRTKTAIVAPADLSYGLARMYGFLSEPSLQEVEIFRDVHKAADWLGVSVQLLEVSEDGD